MQGAWEGRDEEGAWWRFDLIEVPRPPGQGYGLTGTYATDYLDPDIQTGEVSGGLSCWRPGIVMDELMLEFNVEHWAGTVSCTYTAIATKQDGVNGGLLCGSRNATLTLTIQR